MDCVNWVQVDMLKRADLQAPLIDAAVNFYTVLTRKIPFDELCYTSQEYSVTANVATYDLTALDPLLDPPLNAISSIRMTYGGSGATSVRLRRSAVRLYDAISYNFGSRPSTYARWGNSIELNPKPDSSSYTFRLRYYGQAVLNATPQDTVCVIRDEWAELIKWELLYRAYYYLGMYNQAAMLVQPSMMPRQPSPKRQLMLETGMIPRLWNELLTTISMKEAPDEDFSINPVVRNYSLQ
jgi:hypothetical protein